MGPEEFFHRSRLIDENEIFEMRVRSLSWMMDCYQKGTIRRNTIINLIPLDNLYRLLKHLEDVERYEDCAVIKDVIDIIYEQTKPVEIMSTKKQKEIIGLLESTIKSEQDKVGGGNSEVIEKLEKKLNQVKDWRQKDE